MKQSQKEVDAIMAKSISTSCEEAIAWGAGTKAFQS